jgi:hypothetical protein
MPCAIIPAAVAFLKAHWAQLNCDPETEDPSAGWDWPLAFRCQVQTTRDHLRARGEPVEGQSPLLRGEAVEGQRLVGFFGSRGLRGF